MFASLHLLAAALIGIWLLRRFLGTLLDLPEQILGGIAVGWMLAAWVAYLVAELQTRLAYGLMVGLTAFLWLVAAILWASAFRHLSVDRSAVLQPRIHLPLLVLLAFTGCLQTGDRASAAFSRVTLGPFLDCDWLC